MSDEENNLKDMIKEIKKQNEEILAGKEDKAFKLPWKAKLTKGKIKKDWAIVQVINQNRNMDFIKAQIKDGCIEVAGFPRIATTDYMLSWKGHPWIIIPEWSIKPFSPVENYEETVKEKMNMSGRRGVLSTLEIEAIKKKGGFGIVGWIILGVIILGVGYYLISGGNLF